MNESTVPKNVSDDLSIFISTYYRTQPPHPLLIAQKFLLKYQDYGYKFSLSTITDVVENVIK